MIKWFCENPDCENFHKSVSIGKVRYHMKDGNLVPETKKCVSCGQILSYSESIEPGPFKVNLGEFASMTPEGKQAILKKRAIEASKTSREKERIEHTKNRVLKNFLK